MKAKKSAHHRRHRPLVAANWKMALLPNQAVELARSIRRSGFIPKSLDVVVCPSFTAMSGVSDALRRSGIGLGAQDAFWEHRGAFTGEVAVDELAQFGCRFSILGHSERRRLLAETDGMVRRKMLAVLGKGMNPILCVGETAEERRGGRAHAVVTRQVIEALKVAPPPRRGQRIIIAYEPVWAISPGGPAQPSDAREMSEVIRQAIVDRFGSDLGSQLQILYGGSVDAENVRDFVDGEFIHGVLVGSQSQHAAPFRALLSALSKTT